VPAYSDSTLAAVFSKTAGHCSYCGAKLWRKKLNGDDEGAWSVDRWRPRSRSRTAAECDSIENLWPICATCRVDKSETTGSEYLWKRWASDEPVLALWRAWLKDMEQ
jgi:5-methylcytosine-specific restriction endonuclease McrA